MWHPSFRAESLESAGVYLFSEKEKILLRGKIYRLLAPHLSQGKYTADQLASLLEGHASAPSVYFALDRLDKQGYIQAQVDLLPKSLAIFSGLLKVKEPDAYERLIASRICVHALGEPLNPEWLSTFRTLKINVVDDEAKADLSLVIVRDYLQPELLDFHHRAKVKGLSWMPLKPHGSEVWIGPVFTPDKKGCYECLAKRLRKNRVEEDYLQKTSGLQDLFLPPVATLECTPQLAWNLAALEIFKGVVRCEWEREKIVTFDALSLKTQDHVVMADPSCSCGGVSEKQVAPLHLSPQKRADFNGGGYRSVPPEETLKKYSHLVSPITGVVQFLDPLKTTNGSAFYAYTGGINHALPQEYKGKYVRNFRASSGGKGTSETAAKAGCLCESLERASGEFHGDEPRIVASYFQLHKEAIHPHNYLLFSENQVAKRKEATHPFHRVAAPFLEDAMIEWTPLWSLTEQRFKYFPTTCCYYAYPIEGKPWSCYADSNGCAAGNCVEEAILQGFFELVERDSIALWWYNRLHKPAVDLASFEDSYINRLVKEYNDRGREIWVLDITSDLGIPTFVALSRLKRSATEQIFMGFGAHGDAYLALIRALTEMNQFFTAMPFWEEPEVDEEENVEQNVVREWMTTATLENQLYLKGTSTKSAKDYTPWGTPNLLEDITACRKIIESRGMEFLVLDQTRPEIGLPVVKVIVPGLRHFWPRFAPGRLYDVPVQMGWLSKPLKEEELNPIGMFL